MSGVPFTNLYENGPNPYTGPRVPKSRQLAQTGSPKRARVRAHRSSLRPGTPSGARTRMARSPPPPLDIGSPEGSDRTLQASGRPVNPLPQEMPAPQARRRQRSSIVDADVFHAQFHRELQAISFRRSPSRRVSLQTEGDSDTTASEHPIHPHAVSSEAASPRHARPVDPLSLATIHPVQVSRYTDTTIGLDWHHAYCFPSQANTAISGECAWLMDKALSKGRDEVFRQSLHYPEFPLTGAYWKVGSA